MLLEKNNQILIEVVDLRTDFNGYLIHKSISFKVYKGSVFVLMGPSGAGKSSLINFLIQKDSISTGLIYWKNELWDKSNLIEKIGYSPQNRGLFTDLNVGENIAFPLIYSFGFNKSDAYELAMVALVRVGLDNTVFYKDISSLSGGMFKRVLIARSIILSQELLILDEPLSGLDKKSASNLKILIDDLKKEGKTIICITHDYIEGDYYGILQGGQLLTGTRENEKIANFIDVYFKDR